MQWHPVWLFYTPTYPIFIAKKKCYQIIVEGE